MKFKQHYLSSAYPAMQPSEYEALKDSILEIGVQVPITLFDGQIIDGWNRYKAANELGMACPTVNMADVDPRDFAKSQGSRRNITPSQNALAITAIYAWHPVGKPAVPNSAVTAELAKTTKELADIANVGTRTIEQAKAVHSKGVPAVQDAVKSGAVSLETAAAVAKLPEKEQEKVAAEGPKAMRAAAKPKAAKPEKAKPASLVEPEPEAPADYTELDSANDQISELQSELVIARMGNATEEEKQHASELIAELRAEIKTLTSTLASANNSRDSLMEENSQMKTQMQMQRKEIAKLKNSK